jgi:hypothetical protein
MTAMPRKSHGPGVKDPERYEKLREKGMSKEKAARISNTPRKEAGERGGHASKYEDQKKDELLQKAREIGLNVNTRMKKQEIIEALRRH